MKKTNSGFSAWATFSASRPTLRRDRRATASRPGRSASLAKGRELGSFTNSRSMKATSLLVPLLSSAPRLAGFLFGGAGFGGKPAVLAGFGRGHVFVGRGGRLFFSPPLFRGPVFVGWGGRLFFPCFFGGGDFGGYSGHGRGRFCKVLSHLGYRFFRVLGCNIDSRRGGVSRVRSGAIGCCTLFLRLEPYQNGGCHLGFPSKPQTWGTLMKSNTQIGCRVEGAPFRCKGNQKHHNTTSNGGLRTNTPNDPLGSF